jgi:hypothetical protein
VIATDSPTGSLSDGERVDRRGRPAQQSCGSRPTAASRRPRIAGASELRRHRFAFATQVGTQVKCKIKVSA